MDTSCFATSGVQPLSPSSTASSRSAVGKSKRRLTKRCRVEGFMPLRKFW